jgi:hypothetical protein
MRPTPTVACGTAHLRDELGDRYSVGVVTAFGVRVIWSRFPNTATFPRRGTHRRPGSSGKPLIGVVADGAATVARSGVVAVTHVLPASQSEVGYRPVRDRILTVRYVWQSFVL